MMRGPLLPGRRPSPRGGWLEFLSDAGQLDWARASIDTVSVRARRGGPYRREFGRPRQARLQVPPAGRWAGHPTRGRPVGRQPPPLDAARAGHRRGPRDHWSARAARPAPSAPGQAARRQGLRLPQMPAGAAAPRHHPHGSPAAAWNPANGSAATAGRWNGPWPGCWATAVSPSATSAAPTSSRGCSTWPAPWGACGRSGEVPPEALVCYRAQGHQRRRSQALLGSTHGPPSSQGRSAVVRSLRRRLRPLRQPGATHAPGLAAGPAARPRSARLGRRVRVGPPHPGPGRPLRPGRGHRHQPAAHDLARHQRPHPRIRYQVGNLLAITDPDRFDLVVSCTTLHHLPDLEVALQHLRGLVASGAPRS
jgi:hypothetical protein